MSKELIEQLAAIEHQRWADWMEYMFDCAVESGTDEGIGYRTAGWPIEQYDSWKRQIETPYEELSEKEKESDRKQVRRYLHLIKASQTKAVIADLEKLTAKHIETCGATFPENERDYCAWNSIVIKRLAELRRKNDWFYG